MPSSTPRPGRPSRSRRRSGTPPQCSRVRDHGGGLDEEALAHVFDRFWQADRARAGSGVGLGLSIVAAIAHEHGGTATAANHPDGGARFEVSIPITPAIE